MSDSQRKQSKRIGSKRAALCETWPFVVLIIVGVVIYSNILNCPFVFDSVPYIQENVWMRDIGRVADWMTGSQRPVAFFTLALNYSVHGYDVDGYHLVNIAIHAAAACVFFALVRDTLIRIRPDARDNQGLSFAIALLWLVHPLQTQSVTYTIQRMESLMGLFYLLTIYCFSSSVSSQRPANWLVLSSICCWLGMGTKEVMATAPVLVLWYDRVFVAASWREIWKQRSIYYTSLFASWLGLFYIVIAWSQFESGGVGNSGITPVEYALSQPGVIVHYLRLSIVPIGQCVDYWWPVADTLLEIVPAGLLILGLLLLTIWCCFRKPRWSYLGVWFFLILSPSSTVVPIKDLAFEHRMYLPLASVVVLIVLGGYRILSFLEERGVLNRRIAQTVSLFILLALTTFWGSLTYLRNQTYQTELQFWSDVVVKAPHNPRGHATLATTLYDLGDYQKSQQHFEEALRTVRSNPETVNKVTLASYRNNYGLTLKSLGHIDLAIKQWKMAAEGHPGSIAEENLLRTYTRLGTQCRQNGDLDGAIRNFEKARETQPSNVYVLFELGDALCEQSREDEGIEYLEKAVMLEPNLSPARYSVAMALNRKEETSRAIEHLEVAVSTDPTNAHMRNKLVDWHFRLARDCSKRKEWVASELHYKRIVDLKPGIPEAHFEFGVLLIQLGKRDPAAKQLRKAIELDPNLNDAKVQLKRLQE